MGIGCITGLLGKTFNGSVEFLLISIAQAPVGISLIFAPVVGGLFLGVLQTYAMENNPYGFGVSAVREEVRIIKSHLMKPFFLLINTLALVIGLVTGWSVGRQGPVVYVGGAIGSFFAYRIPREEEEIKICIASGVAGALAAVFGEPFFAIAFVIEVILKGCAVKDWAPIIASAMMSSILVGAVGHGQGFLPIERAIGEVVTFEPGILILLGIACALGAAVYVKSVSVAKSIFRKQSSPLIRAILGGGIIAGLGFFMPEIFDARLQVTAQILLDSTDLKFLVVLVISKLIATSVSLGAGAVGGVFMPGLYMGAGIGKIYGVLAQMLCLTTMPTQVYGVIGMVAFFAGFGNAPLSAALLAIELTGNESFLLPVLLAALVAGTVGKWFCKESVYGLD